MHTVTAPTGELYGIALKDLPEGPILATGSITGPVYIWNFGLSENPKVLEGHTGAVVGVFIYDNYLVSHGVDKTVRVWDLASGGCLHVLEGHSEWSCSEMLNSETLATLDNTGVIRLWNLENG